MNKHIHLIFTSGRGPIECELAVQGIQRKFKDYLNIRSIDFEIVSQKKGQVQRSLETIVFKVITHNDEVVNDWTGTLQWICKSPIRKFHKRKNWYIKCEKISLPKHIDIKMNNLKIQGYRASGPGGQHRNKVETAVRITDNNTGISVTSSDSKSKSQNIKNAKKKIRERLESENRIVSDNNNYEEWNTKVDIERGNPVKIFKGLNFKD